MPNFPGAKTTTIGGYAIRIMSGSPWLFPAVMEQIKVLADTIDDIPGSEHMSIDDLARALLAQGFLDDVEAEDLGFQAEDDFQ